VTCANPIDAAILADYWLGALGGPEEEAVEVHLLVCDSCGSRLREVIALAEGVRSIAREGSLRMVVSDAFLRRAGEEGLRIREYSLPAGGSVQCTVAAEDVFLIARLAADLSGAARVDLSLCDEHGVEQQRLEDIPVRPGSSGVTLQESITIARAAPTQTKMMRLLALDTAGRERALGEYTFHHTRTLP
jgi:Putative zinc-finger